MGSDVGLSGHLVMISLLAINIIIFFITVVIISSIRIILSY